LLEVGAAAAAYQQAVAGEGHAEVVQHIGQATVGVAGRGAHGQVAAAEIDAVAVLQRAVDAVGAGCCGQCDVAAAALAQAPGAGDVVGVDVGVERGAQAQAQFLQQRQVARDLFVDWVDQQRLAAVAVAQQIGVGGRGRIEQLAEDDHCSLKKKKALRSPCIAPSLWRNRWHNP
jgi:hypothetical protein